MVGISTAKFATSVALDNAATDCSIPVKTSPVISCPGFCSSQFDINSSLSCLDFSRASTDASPKDIIAPTSNILAAFNPLAIVLYFAISSVNFAPVLIILLAAYIFFKVSPVLAIPAISSAAIIPLAAAPAVLPNNPTPPVAQIEAIDPKEYPKPLANLSVQKFAVPIVDNKDLLGSNSAV